MPWRQAGNCSPCGVLEQQKHSHTSKHVAGAGSGKELPAEDVAVGTVLIVKPGEKVPIDGIVVSGKTHVDQSMLTGEAVPVKKGIDDEVRHSAACVACPLHLL